MAIASVQTLSLAQAARLAPGRPGIPTLWRWMRVGILTRAGRRVRLAHGRAGRRLFTTADDLHKFFREVAEADVEGFKAEQAANVAPPKAPRSRSASVREREIERAEARCRKAGM